jgi:hypothetical protein
MLIVECAAGDQEVDGKHIVARPMPIRLAELMGDGAHQREGFLGDDLLPVQADHGIDRYPIGINGGVVRR